METCGTITPSAKVLQSLLKALFFDLNRSFPFDSNESDLTYLLSRHEKEGDKFLFMTLPLLGKAIEKALILEKPFLVPLGWKIKKSSGSRLPLFLNHIFKKVFEDSGEILPYKDINCLAVFYLRQITLLFSKVVCGIEDDAAINSVLEFKARVTEKFSFSAPTEIIGEARAILRRVFDDPTPENMSLRRLQKFPWGKHGPGAVADRSNPYEKWNLFHWPGINRNLFRSSGTVSIRTKPLDVQPYSKVTVVPKDFKGPRIICIEPKENQFAQQGIMESLYSALQSNYLTKRSIRFDDTSISENLCYRQDVCTIDLKDASDRLSKQLCRLLLPRWIFSLVARYRTRKVIYKDDVWEPQCFLTMGNACCFPIETLVFWAIARATVSIIGKRCNQPVNPLRVYGDDIIAPLWSANALIGVLEGCGLKINRDKTCSKQLVKESCGEWVFNGESQRLIKMKITQITDSNSWLAFRDYQSLCKQRGFLSLAATIDTLLREFLPPSSIRRRWNKEYQRIEYRIPALVQAGKRRQLPYASAFYAWCTRSNRTPVVRARVIPRWTWVAEDPYRS